MKVNFLKKPFMLYAYNIKSPLLQIHSGRAKMIGRNGVTMVLVEKLKTTNPAYNPALNEYEVI